MAATPAPGFLARPHALGSCTLSPWCRFSPLLALSLLCACPPLSLLCSPCTGASLHGRVPATLGVHHTLLTPTLRPYGLAGGNVKGYCCCGKQHGGSSKKTKNKTKQQNAELLYDPSILLVRIPPKEWKAEVQTLVPQCSWQHYSQEPKRRRNPHGHQQQNG